MNAQHLSDARCGAVISEDAGPAEPAAELRGRRCFPFVLWTGRNSRDIEGLIRARRRRGEPQPLAGEWVDLGARCAAPSSEDIPELNDAAWLCECLRYFESVSIRRPLCVHDRGGLLGFVMRSVRAESRAIPKDYPLWNPWHHSIVTLGSPLRFDPDLGARLDAHAANFADNFDPGLYLDDMVDAVRWSGVSGEADLAARLSAVGVSSRKVEQIFNLDPDPVEREAWEKFIKTRRVEQPEGGEE